MNQHETAASFAEFGGDFEIPVIRVSSADPFERGVQHGSGAVAQIDASIDYYATLFKRNHGIEWASVGERALDWADAIESFDTDLIAELRGIAHGAGRSLGEILALNARGEMVYTDLLAADGCTSFVLAPEGNGAGSMLAGQNWDWRVGSAGSRVVLRIEQPPKPTLTMLVEAGQLGRHGVNSEGVALFANGLPARRTEAGVPQAVIRRRILDQARFDRALDAALNSPSQIPANLVLAHRDFAIDIETTPQEARWAYPHDGILTHANHFELFSGPGYSLPSLGADSLYRGHLLRKRLRAASGLSRPEDVLATVADGLAGTFGQPNGIAVHPDPEQPEHLRWATLASTIIDLGEGAWYLADGAPDQRPYRRLPWNVYDRRI